MNTIVRAMEDIESDGKLERKLSSGTLNHVEISNEYFREIDSCRIGEKKSSLLEDYRQIKRELLKNMIGLDSASNDNLILVTSCMAGEGKTFTAINLAVCMALELDKTVLLVDADVVASSICKYLAIESSPGLIEYLKDNDRHLSEYLLKTNIENLTILPAGKPEIRTPEILSGDKMQRLAKELAERYPNRIVIFDAPPVLAASETNILMQYAGQILFVVEAGKINAKMLKEAMSKMDVSKKIGMVLNKFAIGKKVKNKYYGY